MPDKKRKFYNPAEDSDIKQYQEEAEERWGDSEAYKQSMAKVKKMSKEEMEKLKEDGRKLTRKIADSMEKGAGDKEVQILIAEHHKGIQSFYDCPLDMYRNLGKMYVEDSRFMAYYEQFKPGLAMFMYEAIGIYCNNRLKKTA